MDQQNGTIEREKKIFYYIFIGHSLYSRILNCYLL